VHFALQITAPSSTGAESATVASGGAGVELVLQAMDDQASMEKASLRMRRIYHGGDG
jgi:hypothetical protein